MRDRNGANERSQNLKYHVQISGRSLHVAEMQFNDIHTRLQALIAIYNSCNSLNTNALDRTITTPTEGSLRPVLPRGRCASDAAPEADGDRQRLHVRRADGRPAHVLAGPDHGRAVPGWRPRPAAACEGRRVTRSEVRRMKHDIAAGRRADVGAEAWAQGASAALSLLTRSISFGHKRLALIRLMIAVQAGADVPPASWTYCRVVASNSRDDTLRSLFIHAASAANARSAGNPSLRAREGGSSLSAPMSCF